MCLVEGDLGGLGCLSHHPHTADDILQTARCRLQDADKMQTARRRHTETQRRRMKPNSSQPGGPLKGGRRILDMVLTALALNWTKSTGNQFGARQKVQFAS